MSVCMAVGVHVLFPFFLADLCAVQEEDDCVTFPVCWIPVMWWPVCFVHLSSNHISYKLLDCIYKLSEKKRHRSRCLESISICKGQFERILKNFRKRNAAILCTFSHPHRDRYGFSYASRIMCPLIFFKISYNNHCHFSIF